MSHKIQITVDDKFNKLIQSRAKKSGLSVSSFARLALTLVLHEKNQKLLAIAMTDLQSGSIEKLTLADFNRQLDDL